MSFMAGTNRLIGLFLDVFRQMGRWRIWLWLLSYFALQWLLLEAHRQFTSQFLFGIMSAWTGLFGEQEAIGFTHYPGHFLLLPYFFEWAKLYLGLIVEGLFLGAASLLFYESYVQVAEEDRFKARQLWSRWIHLVLVYALLNIILIAASMGLTAALSEWLRYGPRRVLFFEWVILPSLFVFIVAWLLALVPSVVIYRDNALQALRRSLRLFLANPITCLVIAACVLTGPIVVSGISGNPTRIVELFKPELVYWVMVAGLALDMIVHFIWMGVVVRLLVAEEE
ncbi:MAG: hypothetical protein KOO62_08725 [candidate division Zixibacteria bacterium]|nr:hypothetical protein [candidate division Zixibacteria bacterium]